MKKITAILLVVALATVAIAGSTLAYFQDEASAVNVATVGNVKIEQLEYMRAEGTAYNAGEAGKGNGVKEGALVPYVQGRPLFPAVPKNNAATDYTAEATDLFWWGDYVWSGTAGNGLWNDNKLANVHDKMVFVENTGKSDLYFRTIIAFECPEGMEYSQGADKEFMMNINGGSTYAWEEVGYTTIDGVRFLLMSATYLNPLKPGNTSHPSLLQVVMTHNATNEDAAKLGDTYEILVYSQAVQTAGFADAKTALNAAFGEITDKAHPWSKTVILENIDGADFLDAIANDNDIILNTDIVEVNTNAFDGQGATVTLAGIGNNGGDTCYGYLTFLPESGNSATIENLTVTGSGFLELGDYNTQGGNYIGKNLVITDLQATYAVTNGGKEIAAAFSQYGTATLTNCVMTGTTASDFAEGYAVYDAAFVNGTKTFIEGGEYGRVYMANQAAITISDAKIDLIEGNPQGIVSRKTGAKLEIQAGSEVGKIDVAAYSNTYTLNDSIIIRAGAQVDTLVLNMRSCTKKTILNIEDGATVNHLIINGVEVDYNTWING